MSKVKIAFLILSFSSTLFATPPSFANTCSHKCCVIWNLKDGFYLGLQGGYNMHRITGNSPKSGLMFDADFDGAQHLDSKVFAGGAVGGGFIGFGKYFDNFCNVYLGVELFGNAANGQAKLSNLFVEGEDEVLHSINRYIETYTVNYNYGLDLIPGIKLNPLVLLYLRIGYNWTNIEINESMETHVGFPPNYSKISTHNSDNVGGIHYGVGVESAIVDKLSLRLEYTHTDFNSFNTKVGNLHTTGSKYIPAGNQFLLGIIYHFNYC